jgi:hypothetical protein
MDLIGIAGLMVSVLGFTLALWQLARTQRAAEAARVAATEAVDAARFVRAVATIQDISGRSRDLIHLTRARNLHAAATAAFELRDALARFQFPQAWTTTPSPEDWGNTLMSVASIHERLESAALINRIDGSEREKLVHEIARVHEVLGSLAGTTAAAAGG